MRIKLENDWPVNSTRFLVPTIALRGFRSGPRTVTLAWWTWRVVIHLPNAPAHRPPVGGTVPPVVGASGLEGTCTTSAK